MTSESFGEAVAKVPTAHRLAMLDLAPRVANRKTVTPGMAFARPTTRPEKAIARRWLLSRLTRRKVPGGLSIVTMPGLHWEFEWSLLNARESASTFHRELEFRGTRTKRTHLCAIEREPSIYVAGLNRIPGARLGYAEVPSAPYASHSVQTALVRRYHLCTAESFLVSEGPANDVAWFDFNGPLTTERIDGLIQHWRDRIKSTLVVSGMTGRASPDVTALIHGAGGEAPALRGLCEGSEVAFALPYRDTTSMFQVALIREAT